MVQLLVDCVLEPDARDLAFESYVPRFFADNVLETNRLTSIQNTNHDNPRRVCPNLRTTHASFIPIHEPMRNFLSHRVRVIS